MLWRFIHLSLWGSGLGLWLLGYAVLVEPALLFTRHVDFVSDKYEGPELRIGLVTDIHINSPPCLLYTSPSPRDQRGSRMPSSA